MLKGQIGEGALLCLSVCVVTMLACDVGLQDLSKPRAAELPVLCALKHIPGVAGTLTQAQSLFQFVFRMSPQAHV